MKALYAKPHRMFAVALLGAMLAGCASSQYGNLVDKNYSLKLISLRHETGLKYRECPETRLGWQSDRMATLIRAANACEQFHRVTRLQQIGNVLARRFSNKPWGAFYLSLSALDRKQYSQSLWMIELALKKAPNVGLLTYQRGRVLLAMGNLALANQAFRSAAQESPELVDAHLYLAELNERDQNYSHAIVQLKDVIAYEPRNSAAWANLGEIYVLQHETADATEAYQHAVNINPDNLQYQLRLAHLYEASKNEKAALNAYERAQELVENSRVPANQIDVNLDRKISELKKATEPATKTPHTPQGGST